MVYGPHPSGGKPGLISITKDASITALMHEAKHFYADMANGFPGFRIFEDPRAVWKMEFDAYMVEIKFLRKYGHYETADKLITNAKGEKALIENRYNIN